MSWEQEFLARFPRADYIPPEPATSEKRSELLGIKKEVPLGITTIPTRGEIEAMSALPDYVPDEVKEQYIPKSDPTPEDFDWNTYRCNLCRKSFPSFPSLRVHSTKLHKAEWAAYKEKMNGLPGDGKPG